MNQIKNKYVYGYKSPSKNSKLITKLKEVTQIILLALGLWVFLIVLLSI